MEEVGKLSEGNHAHSFARLGLNGQQVDTRVEKMQGVVTERQALNCSRCIPTEKELIFALGRVTLDSYDDIMLPWGKPRQKLQIVVSKAKPRPRRPRIVYAAPTS